MRYKSVNCLVAGCLCLAAAIARSEPKSEYPAILIEAKVMPSTLRVESIEFEVVMDVVEADGQQKTLRLSGGGQIGLYPGEYYRVIDYGDGSARLAELEVTEKIRLARNRAKAKLKR